MANKIVRLDVMAATKDDSLVKSAKYTGAIQNGEIVELGKLVSGEREIFEAKAATEDSAVVGIVCTPEVIYDQTGVGDRDLSNFINADGDIIRVDILTVGDTFSIANEGVGADKEYANITAEFQGTEKVGRYTYNVYICK